MDFPSYRLAKVRQSWAFIGIHCRRMSLPGRLLFTYPVILPRDVTVIAFTRRGSSPLCCFLFP